MVEEYKTEGLALYNSDCMIEMRAYPDKYFDLAIVDPPYGIGFGEFNRTNKDAYGNRYKANKYKNGTWDNEGPSLPYFCQLERISKNQIIWGANHFISQLPLSIADTPCFIFWYKQNPVDNFSDGELAWTSFKSPAKCFNYPYYGAINAEQRLHPTQKPVKLYEWLLKNYAKPGDKILDTHLGSGSSAIACYNLDYHLTGFEIDTDYFTAMKRRIEQHLKQQRLFDGGDV